MITDIDTKLGTAEAVKGHAEWVSLPMTQSMLEQTRKFVRPVAISPAAGATLGEQALLNYGVQLGMEAVLDFLQRAPLYAQAVAKATTSAEPDADFGASEILKTLGYGKQKEE